MLPYSLESLWRMRAVSLYRSTLYILLLRAVPRTPLAIMEVTETTKISSLRVYIVSTKKKQLPRKLVEFLNPLN